MATVFEKLADLRNKVRHFKVVIISCWMTGSAAACLGHECHTNLRHVPSNSIVVILFAMVLPVLTNWPTANAISGQVPTVTQFNEPTASQYGTAFIVAFSSIVVGH